MFRPVSNNSWLPGVNSNLKVILTLRHKKHDLNIRVYVYNGRRGIEPDTGLNPFLIPFQDWTF